MFVVLICVFFFFFKQKTAYEMRISDWSSDVCSSDLVWGGQFENQQRASARLVLVIPIALLLIFFVLLGTLRSLLASVLILVNIPFAMVGEIGRASCRERVCQYVYISVVADSLKKKKVTTNCLHSQNTTNKLNI